jgi:ribosomal protein L37E
MPYVRCARCGLTAYSVAYRLDVEHCAKCGAELPRPQSVLARGGAGRR